MGCLGFAPRQVLGLGNPLSRHKARRRGPSEKRSVRYKFRPRSRSKLHFRRRSCRQTRMRQSRRILQAPCDERVRLAIRSSFDCGWLRAVRSSASATEWSSQRVAYRPISELPRCWHRVGLRRKARRMARALRETHHLRSAIDEYHGVYPRAGRRPDPLAPPILRAVTANPPDEGFSDEVIAAILNVSGSTIYRTSAGLWESIWRGRAPPKPRAVRRGRGRLGDNEEFASDRHARRATAPREAQRPQAGHAQGRRPVAHGRRLSPSRHE